MSAYSAATRSASPDLGTFSEADKVQQGALAKLVDMLPAEGLTVYVGIFGLATAVPFKEVWVNATIAFACVVVALGVSLLATALAILNVGRFEGDPISDDRKRRAWKQGTLIAFLFLIYISAVSGNPFNVYWSVPLWVGTAIAVVVTSVIGIIIKSSARPRPQPVAAKLPQGRASDPVDRT